MIARRPVTAALRSLIADATGLPCGRGSVPMSRGSAVEPPYYVLTAVDTVLGGPPLADTNDDADLVYQVTCVAEGSEQAELLADDVRAAVLGRDPGTGAWLNALGVPGVSCMGRELDTEPGETSDPADGIISYVIRFRLCLTPATVS